MITIDLESRSPAELLSIASRACSTLSVIASYITVDEGDQAQTEQDTGLDMSEAIECAHDDMIERARSILRELGRLYPKKDRP